MRCLLVLPLFLALAAAEEQFIPGQMNSPSQFAGDILPEDAATLEERILEEEMKQIASHLEDEVPHPHLVRQGELHPERIFPESLPENVKEEVIVDPHNPVPDPHLVEEEPISHHIGVGGDEVPHRRGSVEMIHHNAVEELPFQVDGPGEESFPGTESTLGNDLFEHHPNTGVPDLEPTVGTEAGTGMEVVQEPVVLPVTEGKNRGQDAQYGLPKELMPIHPGGGSKFEDLEREKMEKKKMSQTKGMDDDTENGASHEAEGLYSSAATLCLSSIIFSLSSSFRLIV